MSITFMTNEDKSILEQNINKLSEEMDGVKESLAMSKFRTQGGIVR